MILRNLTPRLMTHKRFLGALATALALGVGTPASAAQLSSAPVTLSDYGLQQGQLLGWTLALSPDGHVAAGGAVAYNRSGTNGTDYTGAAYVYFQSTGNWSGPIMLPNGSVPTGAFLGSALAIPDDTQVIVGAQSANSSQGEVYVFNQTGGSWNSTPAVTPLTLPPSMQGQYFGEGLAVSGNGQVLFVGTGPTQGTTLGEIYAYSVSGNSWGSPVALPMTGIPAGTDVGRVLAASANGDVLIAGAPQATNAYGAAWVWTKTGSSWNNPVALALPSSLGPKGTIVFFGQAVAISADGTEVLVGAPGANNPSGAAYLYTQSGGTWSAPPVMLTSPLPNSNSFGSSVALSPDGTAAFMGMPINNTGYVFVSTHGSSGWSTPAALSTSNLPVNALVGTQLAAGDNGEELLTSGETVNNNIGGLFVYDSPATITLADSPSATAIAPGSTLTFDLGLTNADQPGSTPATTLNNVVLTDILPTGVTYVSSNAANGSCNNSGKTVTCTLTSLAPGNNNQNPWAPSITVKTPATASKLTNSVSVSANEPLIGSSSVNTQVINDVTPVAIAGGVATTPGTAVSGTLTATPGFSGQSLTFAMVTAPGNGTLKLTNASTGAFTYTPNTGFTGTDVFIFNVGDGVVTSNFAAEIVTVSATGITPPVANNQTLSVVEGQTLDGQLSATSPNGHGLTYAATSQPAHGTLNVTNSTGAFTYTPAPGYTGSDAFTFTANDGTTTSNSATVNITVQATSTAPASPPTTSGKSGGGGLGILALALLGGLLGMRKNRHRLSRSPVTFP